MILTIIMLVNDLRFFFINIKKLSENDMWFQNKEKNFRYDKNQSDIKCKKIFCMRESASIW
jgi:hypothetical protein